MRFNMFFLSLLILGLVACGSEESNEEESSEETTEETTENTNEETTENEYQILEPVTWNFSTEMLEENTYKVTYEATIDPGWYVYSQFLNDGGPIPTTVYFDENAAVVNTSEVEEMSDHVNDGYDKMFDMDVKKFSHSVVFSQTIEVSEATTLTGEVEYMTCDSIQCIFPDPAKFELALGN